MLAKRSTVHLRPAAIVAVMFLSAMAVTVLASSGVGKYGVMKWGGDADKKWDEDTPPQWLMLLMLESSWGTKQWRQESPTL